MKRFCILIVLSIVLISFNVMAADLTGWWYVTDSCPDGDESHYVYIEMNGDFFTAESEDNSQVCQGVLVGKKFHMTCPPDLSCASFAYGKAKKNKIEVVNHIPCDGKTCTAVAVRSDPPE